MSGGGMWELRRDEITGWWSPTNPADPVLRTTLEVFKRQKIAPALWVMGSGSLTKTEAEQRQRVEEEAERLRQIVELAKPYGVSVHLYNHNGWFGIPDNEVAVIERLKERGVTGVGMIYNFSHGHQDVADFAAVWKRMQPYVVAVNVTGMVPDGEAKLMPPSQGEQEQALLRVVLESGWRGPIGLIAEQGGDPAKVNPVVPVLEAPFAGMATLVSVYEVKAEGKMKTT